MIIKEDRFTLILLRDTPIVEKTKISPYKEYPTFALNVYIIEYYNVLREWSIFGV